MWVISYLYGSTCVTNEIRIVAGPHKSITWIVGNVLRSFVELIPSKTLDGRSLSYRNRSLSGAGCSQIWIVADEYDIVTSYNGTFSVSSSKITCKLNCLSPACLRCHFLSPNICFRLHSSLCRSGINKCSVLLHQPTGEPSVVYLCVWWTSSQASTSISYALVFIAILLHSSTTIWLYNLLRTFFFCFCKVTVRRNKVNRLMHLSNSVLGRTRSNRKWENSPVRQIWIWWKQNKEIHFTAGRLWLMQNVKRRRKVIFGFGNFYSNFSFVRAKIGRSYKMD